MNQRLNYFSVCSFPYTGTEKLQTSQVLVLLDIQQNRTTHHSLLERLSEQADVICLEMINQHPETDSFHWNPTLTELHEELTNIFSELGPVHCCIAHGFAATLIQYLPIARMNDILCNPTLPTKDIRLVQILSRFLWSDTKISNWFTHLIEASWKEHLQWPLQGKSPWVSHSEMEQGHSSLKLTNGTWKQIFNRILEAPKDNHPTNIVVLLGSESAAVSSASPFQAQHYFSNSTVRHCVFSGLRQELLLAESVQQDILQICKELL